MSINNANSYSYQKKFIKWTLIITIINIIRERLKLARDEVGILDKLWYFNFVIGPLNSFIMCLLSIVHEATLAYIYGEL